MPKQRKSHKHLIPKKSPLPDYSAPLSGFDSIVGSGASGPQELVVGGGGAGATINAVDVAKRSESGEKTETESSGKVANEHTQAAPIAKSGNPVTARKGIDDSAQSSPSSETHGTGVSPSSVAKSTDSSGDSTPPDVPKIKRPAGERGEEARSADAQPEIPNQECDESSSGAGRTALREMAKQVDQGAMTVVQKRKIAKKAAEDTASSTGHTEGGVLTKAGKHKAALKRDGQVRTFVEMPKELHNAIMKRRSFGGTFRMAVCVALYKQFLPDKLDVFLGGGEGSKAEE